MKYFKSSFQSIMSIIYLPICKCFLQGDYEENIHPTAIVYSIENKSDENEKILFKIITIV